MSCSVLPRFCLASILALVAFVLAGCFSIGETLSLNSDNSGQLTFRTRLAAVAASEVGSLPVLLSGPGLQRQTEQQADRTVIRTESIAFQRLADVSLHIGGLRIDTVSGNRVMTRTHPRDPSIANTLNDMRPFLFGEVYRFAFRANGAQLVDVGAVTVNGRSYFPDLIGSEAVWTIPMLDFLEHTSRNDLAFRVSYRP